MQIINYPHPTLRHRSKPVRRINAELVKITQEMFQLMYVAKGVGLAANQVDLPIRLFVVNLAAEPGQGEELIFINPVITHPKGIEEREEGCLSLPGLYGQVKRPERVQVTAYNLKGEEFTAKLSGLFARVVQHETDHLDGVLFTDRLSTTGAMAAREAMEEFEIEFRSRRQTGAIPSDAQIAEQLAELEKKFC